MSSIGNIKNYEVKQVPSGDDKLLGTDSTDGATRNFVISSLGNAVIVIPVYATFALLEADINNLQKGRIYFVEDDEGSPNWFGFDGTNLNWFVTQQV